MISMIQQEHKMTSKLFAALSVATLRCWGSGTLSTWKPASLTMSIMFSSPTKCRTPKAKNSDFPGEVLRSLMTLLAITLFRLMMKLSRNQLSEMNILRLWPTSLCPSLSELSSLSSTENLPIVLEMWEFWSSRRDNLRWDPPSHRSEAGLPLSSLSAGS